MRAQAREAAEESAQAEKKRESAEEKVRRMSKELDSLQAALLASQRSPLRLGCDGRVEICWAGREYLNVLLSVIYGNVLIESFLLGVYGLLLPRRALRKLQAPGDKLDA